MVEVLCSVSVVGGWVLLVQSHAHFHISYEVYDSQLYESHLDLQEIVICSFEQSGQRCDSERLQFEVEMGMWHKHTCTYQHNRNACSIPKMSSRMVSEA